MAQVGQGTGSEQKAAPIESLLKKIKRPLGTG
jgi:hypothetical protein